MNIIFDENIYSKYFIQDVKIKLEHYFSISSIIEVNEIKNENDFIFILPILKKIPHSFIPNNISVYLPNNYNQTYIHNKKIFYIPDEISFYIMKYSSLILTTIPQLYKFFSNICFLPTLFQKNEVVSKIFLEMNYNLLHQVLLLIKPLFKKIKNTPHKENFSFIVYNNNEYIIYDPFLKKSYVLEPSYKNKAVNLIPLIQKNTNQNNIFYINNEDIPLFENDFENVSFENEFFDFLTYSYFLTKNNIFKIKNSFFKIKKPVTQNFTIIEKNNFGDFVLQDNIEFYFFNQKKDFPIFTIFIISVDSKQFNYTLKSIEMLDRKFSFIVHFIYKISPTSKAYSQMPKRCKTKYFVQCDEDMILQKKFLQNIFTILKLNMNENYFLYISPLYDRLLGVTDHKILWGIKVYNNIILHYFHTVDETDNVHTSSVDRYWHQKLLENNFKIYKNKSIVGTHAYFREPDEFFLKMAKCANNIFYGINKDDDNLRFLKVLFDISKNDLLYYCILFTNDIFENIFHQKIDTNNLIQTLITLIHKSKNFENKYFDNYFLSKKEIQKIDFYKKSTQKYIYQNDKINFLGFFGFVYGYLHLYQYNFQNYPFQEISQIKEKLLLHKNCLIISSQIPNYGGSGTNALTLKKYLSSHFIQTKLLIIDEDNMMNENMIEFENDVFICSKKYFESTSYDKILQLFFINDISLVINRNPQSKYISTLSLKKMFPCKILNIVGGGIRVYQQKKLLPFYNTYQNILSINKKQNKIKEIKNIVQESLLTSCKDSDYIITNSIEIHNVLHELFMNQLKGVFYTSFINKETNNIIFDYKNYNEEYEKIYDILFICSNLKREVKNIELFKNICSNLPDKKIIVIGKHNFSFNLPHVEHIDFTTTLDEYYLQSKLVINTSYYDSSPSVISDSIYYDCNVLLTKNVGNFDLFNDKCIISENDYFNVDVWVKKINYLLEYKVYPLKNNAKEKIRNNLQDFINLIVELME